jgi:23S rRNA (cytidine1920-2'-O)/16S rRNA (cytidine1409-2'-O)-methyltransferase
MGDKKRIDLILVEKGLAPSRARAQELVKNGLVKANNLPVSKPSSEFDPSTDIAVSGDVHSWVSRGGQKLDHALQEFSIAVGGKTCLDLGASTGGFTDVLLHHGARKVYAVDVGHGQLAEKLKSDTRVVNIEGMHAKDLDAKSIPERVDIIVIDVSFIGLSKVLPFAAALAAKECDLVCLVKPQFEVGRENIGRGGIVRDDAMQRKACTDVQAFIESTLKWDVKGIIKSPIDGGDGNREFLLAASNY